MRRIMADSTVCCQGAEAGGDLASLTFALSANPREEINYHVSKHVQVGASGQLDRQPLPQLRGFYATKMLCLRLRLGRCKTKGKANLRG